MKDKTKKILAIDPGASGAICIRLFGRVENYKLLNDFKRNIGLIEDIVFVHQDRDDLIAFVEDVGKHVAGNAAQGSIALARNHQNIKTCLYMMGIETVDVSPQRWTKEIGVQVKDERSKEEKARVRNLPKAEKDKENAKHRRDKKAKKNGKIRALLKERGIDESNIPDYALDAYGIYLYAVGELNKAS